MMVFDMSSTDESTGILLIKGKMHIPQMSASGLILIFINPSDSSILNCISVIISGSELYRIPLSQPTRELFNIIKTAPTMYTVSTERNVRLSEYIKKHFSTEIVKSLLEKISINDIDFVNGYIGKEIKVIFSIDDVEVQTEDETISRGDYLKISVEEEIEKLTFAKKVARVQQYVANKTALAEKIVQDNLDDMAIISFTFRYDEENVGAGLVFYNNVLRDFYKIFIALPIDRKTYSIDINDSTVDFYFKLNEIVSTAELNNELISEIGNRFKGLHKGAVYDLIKSSEQDEVKKLVYQVLRDFIGEQIILETRIENMNSLKVDLLLHPGEADEKSKKGEEEFDEFANIKLIDVIPLLSPAKGIRISDLQKDDQIQVVIDSKNPLGFRLLKTMNLVVDDRVKPVSSKLYSVKYKKGEGYKLIVRITDELYGRAVEEEDVKVKVGDPVIQEERKKSRVSMLIGIIAGLIVIAIMVLILLL
jgi:hypothetical protein